MKKILNTILCTSLFVLTGCTKTDIESADDHYSGCTFLVESGDYYNVGFEIHYSNSDEIEWNYVLEHQVHQLLEDLTVDTAEPVSLVENREYCGDIKRANSQTQRYALAIPHDLHDELVAMLEDFSFTLTLESKISSVKYTSKVNLPIIDTTVQTNTEGSEQASEEAAE